ncbi:hypothetical protein EX30DRAFT_107615 [Ascodesmis nigricans]|uniref:Uncharacterized protein n=1 Tax=Ascodesmis nigricans TaxID=341454 RepID=A0A4S2MQC7_9PEZI|nr:hypothetical protein EX30DRAFT_107615 [Ascodesmis nigricans]
MKIVGYRAAAAFLCYASESNRDEDWKRVGPSLLTGFDFAATTTAHADEETRDRLAGRCTKYSMWGEPARCMDVCTVLCTIFYIHVMYMLCVLSCSVLPMSDTNEICTHRTTVRGKLHSLVLSIFPSLNIPLPLSIPCLIPGIEPTVLPQLEMTMATSTLPSFNLPSFLPSITPPRRQLHINDRYHTASPQRIPAPPRRRRRPGIITYSVFVFWSRIVWIDSTPSVHAAVETTFFRGSRERPRALGYSIGDLRRPVSGG